MSEKNPSSIETTIDEFWYENALPQFKEFVTIPCISPGYDPDWKKQGALRQARHLAKKWIASLKPLCAKIHVGLKETEDGEVPPILLIQIPAHPAETPGNVLTYGHFDKQTVRGEDWTAPPNAKTKGPFVPNIHEDHLYGRGTSDDGFATFTVITALHAMNQCGIAYPNVNVIIDFDEESGSANLRSSLLHFKDIIGQPDLCIELDSSIGNYEQLWYGSTARGTITGTLSVKMLSTAVHSGDGGGIIPNPVNLMRTLLDRIQDPATGKVVIPEFQVPVPAANLADAQAQAANLGAHLVGDFPWVGGTYPYLQDPVQLVLNKTWRAALAITGQHGLPTLETASNVIVPEMEYQLSLRLPPSVDVHAAQVVLKRVLEADPPFGAEVNYTFRGDPIGAGWITPPRASWFARALVETSREVFDRDPSPFGDGGTIPVLSLMTELYASDRNASPAQILATGAAGPGNNEHGANENLDMGYARKLSLALVKMFQATARETCKQNPSTQTPSTQDS